MAKVPQNGRENWKADAFLNFSVPSSKNLGTNVKVGSVGIPLYSNKAGDNQLIEWLSNDVDGRRMAKFVSMLQVSLHVVDNEAEGPFDFSDDEVEVAEEATAEA